MWIPLERGGNEGGGAPLPRVKTPIHRKWTRWLDLIAGLALILVGTYYWCHDQQNAALCNAYVNDLQKNPNLFEGSEVVGCEVVHH